MEPTIFSNDIIVSEHITSKLSKYERGDVVILRSPTDPNMFICKRIIGIPGDKIKVNYIQNNIVPRGHIWVEGDNKGNSTDSRSYGPVPQGLVRGRALCRVWPPNSIKMLTSENWIKHICVIVVIIFVWMCDWYPVILTKDSSTLNACSIGSHCIVRVLVSWSGFMLHRPTCTKDKMVHLQLFFFQL